MKFRPTFILCAIGIASVFARSHAAAEDLPPLRLGVQTWTFRSSTFVQTLDKVQALGLHYIQVAPKQKLGGGMEGNFDIQMSEATRAKVLQLAHDHDITIAGMGVINGKDEAEWRALFEFAKAMGMTDITSEPPQTMLPMIDKLSQEYHITVSLHNHPPPSRYANLDTALDAIKSCSNNIGICADTGHWMRAGYDPVVNLKRAEGRILAVHFKDLNVKGVKTAIDLPWGTGVSDAAGQIAELRRQHYAGIVYMEYEHDTPALFDEATRCVAFFQKENAK